MSWDRERVSLINIYDIVLDLKYEFRAEDTLALTVYPSDYMGKLVDYCMLKIYGLIKVKETNQTWSEEDDFVLEKPKLQVEV